MFATFKRLDFPQVEVKVAEERTKGGKGGGYGVCVHACVC